MKHAPLLILLAVAAVVAITTVTYFIMRGPPPGINDPRTELKEFIP